MPSIYHRKATYFPAVVAWNVWLAWLIDKLILDNGPKKERGPPIITCALAYPSAISSINQKLRMHARKTIFLTAPLMQRKFKLVINLELSIQINFQLHCRSPCNKIFKIRPDLTIFWQKQFKSFLLSWNVCLVKYVRLEQLWKLMEKIAPTTIYMHRTTIYVSWTYYKDSYNKIYIHGTNYIKLCNKYLYTLEGSYELAE